MATAVSTPTENRVAISATKLLINGKWVESVSGKRFKTVNPSTGEAICDVAEAERIREAARCRDIRINAFILQALKNTWNQQLPLHVAIEAPLTAHPQQEDRIL